MIKPCGHINRLFVNKQIFSCSWPHGLTIKTIKGVTGIPIIEKSNNDVNDEMGVPIKKSVI
jgi:hypothetical protein